jgi:glycosyltransferase involved in cell wall biosynthesis
VVTEASPLVTAQAPAVLDLDVPIVLYVDEWGGVGGTAGYAVMLARALTARGYRVAAVCHGAESMTVVRAALADAGAAVHTIAADGDTSLPGRWRRHRAFMETVQAHPGCVLVLIMGYFTRGGGMTLAAKQAGAAAVVRADLTPPEPPIGVRDRLSLRLKDLLVDRVVVGARENREAFERQLGRAASKVDVVNTGIELARFQPGRDRAVTREALGFSASDRVVGTLSRLDDQRKGVDHFLNMAALVAAACPDTRFLIVGDGVLRHRLEQAAADMNVAERVVFAGWHADVPPLLASMDVFVMPSLFEGGPTSLLEAMAMALPVVATRVGMVAEVIEDGENGLIVSPGDVPALVRATETLLGDDALRIRIGGAARTTAVERFSIERMADGYLNVMASALGVKQGKKEP